MEATPRRVAARFLEAGTIHVPPRLLADVQEWAMAQVAQDLVKTEEYYVSRVELAIREFEDKISDSKDDQKGFLELWEDGDRDGATTAWKMVFDKTYKHTEFWGSDLHREFLTPERFAKEWDNGTFPQALDRFLTAYRNSFERILKEEELPMWTLRMRKVEGLRTRLNTRFKGNPQDFQIVGNDTVYPVLRGKVFPFKAIYQAGTVNGSWDWDKHILVITPFTTNVEDVPSVVRHEVQHAMQNFLSVALGHPLGVIDRTVGIGPRKTRTPQFIQQQPTVGMGGLNAHDLDDIEFHTELEDAKDRLRAVLRLTRKNERTQRLNLFIDADKFLVNLRATPLARAKYQLALKELGRVVANP